MLLIKFAMLFLTSLYSADYRSILWITSSTSDVNEIIKFKADNNLSFELSLLSDSMASMPEDSAFEYIDGFLSFYPVETVFFPSKSGIKEFQNYDDSGDLFRSFFDYYYTTYLKMNGSRGLLSGYGVGSYDMISLAKDHGYNWIFGGISSSTFSGVKKINDFNTVFFDLLRSTDAIYTSSNTFFIVNDMDSSNSSLDMLKDILADKSISFIKVSDAVMISTPSVIDSTDSFQGLFIPLNETVSCPAYLNYMNYLVLLTEDISKKDYSTAEDIFENYINLFNYFKDICQAKESFADDIREITNNIYINLYQDPPYFINYDFLNNFNIKKYVRNNTDTGVYFNSLSSQTIKSFSVVSDTSTDSVVFTIEFSTQNIFDETHIYIDINQRRNAGSDIIIGRDERIDGLYGWEYAFVIKDSSVVLYKNSYRDYYKFKTYRLSYNGDRAYFKVKASDLIGNFVNWNYTVVNYDKNQLIDGIYETADMKFLYPVTY